MVSIKENFLCDTSFFSQAQNAFIPQYAFVSFSQDGRTALDPCVRLGDTVTEGQVIAGKNAASEAKVHSPIPGEVCGIVGFRVPNGRIHTGAKIRFAGSFQYEGRGHSVYDWKNATPKELTEKLAENGVVNTFAKNRSLSQQVKKTSANLVVRLYDEDPSMLTDSFAAFHHFREIAEGAAVVAKIIGAKGVTFLYSSKHGFSPDKAYCASLFERLTSGGQAVKLLYLAVPQHKYPLGTAEKSAQIIKKASLLEPFSKITSRDLFIDALTAFNVYKAVVLSIPVMSALVHVSGCVKKPCIISAKIGTLIKEIAHECGGFTRDTKTVIINGMLQGASVNVLETPITKSIKSIRFLPSAHVKPQRYTQCMKCGRCQNVCPMRLLPSALFSHAAGIKILDAATASSVKYCSGCALCNTVCPARLPLSQFITFVKENTHGR
ncbi:MAG: electron transport complex subunit RsxC [Treponemataceae bacterium]|nr:MAG: electron transport complex subunit RsxC [Treponemataceae bacterium]